MTPLFVALQDTRDPKKTIYPQVHYIYADDTFSPAEDILEQEKDDISLLVDVNEEGKVMACSSLSANWQVLGHSTQTQQLQGDFQSRLLLINGTTARQPADIPDLDGSFAGCVESARKVVAQLERRNDELRQALERSAGAAASANASAAASANASAAASVHASIWSGSTR